MSGRYRQQTARRTHGTSSSRATRPSRSLACGPNSNLEITSCTIITEPSAAPVNQVHDRQPLILDPAYYEAWLDPKSPAGDLKDILNHDIDGQLQFYRVGREVNAAAVNKQPNDYSGLIEPIKLL